MRISILASVAGLLIALPCDADAIDLAEQQGSDGSARSLTDTLPFPMLIAYGGDPNSTFFPLNRCEGDCDNDDHCADGLSCFQRNANENVPGCFGGLMDGSNSDYCIPSHLVPAANNNPPQPTEMPSMATEAPTAWPVLPLVSYGGNPNSTFLPLNRCEGDCDNNDHCADGLMCFQRNANETVPGCFDGSIDTSNTDYCIPSHLVPAANNNPPQPTEMPSMATEAPTAWPVLPLVSYGGNPNSTLFPLNRCEGDCDNNDHCADGLMCFQRDANDAVPGCFDGSVDTSNTDYCVPDSSYVKPAPIPTSQPSQMPFEVVLPLVSYGGNPNSTFFPLSRCEGDCDNDDHCADGLMCFQRDANVAVPGCFDGSIDSSNTDYCVYDPSYVEPDPIPTSQPTEMPSVATEAPTAWPVLPLVSYGGNPDSTFFPLNRCEGDCDNNDHCADGLMCFQRDANETVPGCFDGSVDTSNTDYCVPDPSYVKPEPVPTSQPTPQAVVATHPPYPFPILPLLSYGSKPDPEKLPLQRCEGDCDIDEDCANGLICFQRGPNDLVPQCSGGLTDVSSTDYCIIDLDRPPTESPTSVPTATPLDLVIRDSSTAILNACEGPCTSDSHCADGTSCLYRNAGDSVRGCIGTSLVDMQYCVADIEPTYIPGHLSVSKYGLILSEGLDARLVATSGSTVKYDNGQSSSIPFHGRPDGAATFADTDPNNEGGWIYVSNSEMFNKGTGGVGGITFDKDGNTLDYNMLLEDTTYNCGGGRTPWNTWISCEEYSTKGNVYQVDPLGIRPPQMINLNGDTGKYESFAADNRDPNAPVFYITEDRHIGGLTRIRPVNDGSSDWNADPWSMLHGTVVVDYLMLSTDGTFSWTPDRTAAGINAEIMYPNTEGIDVYENELFFICKKIKMMYTVDLDGNSWFRESTRSGTFSGQPDQLQRILGDSRDLLYFTEEGSSSAGIHARDHLGNFYTVLEAPSLSSETTGLAVSPDGKYMMVAYQDDGHLFMVWRKDGHPFDGQRLDIKYHHA